MIRFYPPIFLLQMFCLYHAYSSNSERKWFWIIVIFPFFGSLFYLYDNFYSERNIEDLSEGIKDTFISNYKIERLEKELKYAETVSNKINLADEHLAVGNYRRALALYESCLDGVHDSDLELVMKLMKTNYLLKDYKTVVQLGEELINEKEFGLSGGKVALAWSYYHLAERDKAAQTFETMDIRFSNYQERMEYAEFLRKIDKPEAGKEKLQELLEEIDSMDRLEKKQKREIYWKIKKEYEEFG